MKNNTITESAKQDIYNKIMNKVARVVKTKLNESIEEIDGASIDYFVDSDDNIAYVMHSETADKLPKPFKTRFNFYRFQSHDDNGYVLMSTDKNVTTPSDILMTDKILLELNDRHFFDLDDYDMSPETFLMKVVYPFFLLK